MFRACLWQFLWSENGVELARFLRERKVNASIIYITDYPGFALDSFPTYPLEYLLKPVSAQELAPVYLRISQAERERNARLQQESTQK